MKVLGIGNSLVDMLCRLPNEEILTKYGLPKGGMTLIDRDTAVKISADIRGYECKYVAGGSAANTMSGLAKLGGNDISFLGKVGKDDEANAFVSDLEGLGCSMVALRSELPTGRCISLISPDGERTMCTCLGATGELSAEDARAESFSGVDLCHLGGYLVQNHEMIEAMMREAKKAGAKISLDLASYNVVNENYDFMHYLVREYVDIVFANEEESMAYAKVDSAEKAVGPIAEDAEITIVKCGANGVFESKHGATIFTPSLPGRHCIDTTGAGDLFASGYLHGLIENRFEIGLPAKYGNIVGANIIEHVGTRMSDEVWAAIKVEMQKVKNA